MKGHQEPIAIPRTLSNMSSSGNTPRNGRTGHVRRSPRKLLAALVFVCLTFIAHQAFVAETRWRWHLDSLTWSIRPHSAPLPQGNDTSYVAMCLTARDEHCDIREWVLYHASIGAGKFYIFDTASDPPMQPVLQDLIDSGLVEYNYVTPTSLNLSEPEPGRSYNWQDPVYTLCLEKYGPRHTWMAFIDADEFIILKDGMQTLPQLLYMKRRFAGLVLHWQYFAFSGNIERPSAGVLASYTACCPQDHRPHRHVKSIVQPRHVKGVHTVHSFKYKLKRFAVSTGGFRVDDALIPKDKEISYKYAVLHHYISRSLADFEVKMQRRGGAGSVKTLGHFLTYYRNCSETCTAGVALGQRLGQLYDLQYNVPDRCFPPT